jgi:glycosyltransferase involved in cell wall biosynthesis
MGRHRVCIVRRHYFPEDPLVLRNAESLVAAGYSVDLICLRHEAELAFEVVGGVRVHRLPLRSRRGGIIRYLLEYVTFFILAFFKVTWLHFRQTFDVVEALSMPDFLIFTGMVPRLLGSRLILQLFESMPELWAQKRNVPMTHWTIRLLKWQQKLSCAYADAVTCCHAMARASLIATNIPEDKITIILNVPNENVFKEYQRINPTDGICRLIQTGTITEDYGIQVVIKALKLLDPSLAVHYDVTGYGEYRSILEDMVRELGLQDRVTFHGYIPRERFLELLIHSDIGVVPMLLEYQSPTKMFEFVALGKPIIASDRKTFLQYFNVHEILYFKTGDEKSLAAAIEAAIRQPSMMSELAKRARLRYEQYRWGNMRDRYLELYENLCKGEAISKHQSIMR